MNKRIAAMGMSSSIRTNYFNPITTTLTILFVIATVAYPINGLGPSRKLDESTVPGGDDVKCTPSCVQSSPPPPSPPPPSPPPPALPPPTPKKPPSNNNYCPPPPPPPASIIYITGPPGNLYPIDQNYGGASRSLKQGILPLVCGFLVVLAF